MHGIVAWHNDNKAPSNLVLCTPSSYTTVPHMHLCVCFPGAYNVCVWHAEMHAFPSLETSNLGIYWGREMNTSQYFNEGFPKGKINRVT